jgi:hypothetical protein
MSSPHNPYNINPCTNVDKPGSQNCGKTTQITPRDLQHVLGGVKRHKWSRRLSWNTKLCKGALLGPIHVVLASISPHISAVVLITEIGGCIELKKSQAQLIVHTVHTTLLEDYGHMGQLHTLSNLLRPRTHAAHSEGRGRPWRAIQSYLQLTLKKESFFSVLVY